jgi:hypothetical protein
MHNQNNLIFLENMGQRGFQNKNKGNALHSESRACFGEDEIYYYLS